MPPSLRETAGRLLLVLLSLAASLLLGELGLRAAGFTPARMRSRARVLGLEQPLMLDCFPTNPRHYFEIDLREPAMQQRYRELLAASPTFDVARTPWAVESRFNSQRFRDAEFQPKRPGVTRVMLLGDSFTEGEGVREPDTYAKVLERLLNGAPGQRFEVLNCGRRGADFPALFETFEELLRYEPDLVIYGMVLNDAERPSSLDAAYPALNDWIIDRRARVSPGAVESWHSSLWDFCRERVETHRVSRQATQWYRDMYGDANADGWRRTQGHLARMNDAMRARGGRLLLALWPLLVSLEGRYPFAEVHQTIAAAGQRLEIPFHDLLPALRGSSTASLWVHVTDMHPNERAHRLAAESLLPVVRGLAGPSRTPGS